MSKQKDEVARTNEFGLLRAYLAQQGISQEWINLHVDNTDTRAESAEKLKVAMKTLT